MAFFEKTVTKTLYVDDEKFEDNFRFYPTGKEYKDQTENQRSEHRKKYVGSLHPQANVDLQYIIDTIKATDGGFYSKRYVINFSIL